MPGIPGPAAGGVGAIVAGESDLARLKAGSPSSSSPAAAVIQNHFIAWTIGSNLRVAYSINKGGHRRDITIRYGKSDDLEKFSGSACTPRFS